jgi:hypothetical protein
VQAKPLELLRRPVQVQRGDLARAEREQAADPGHRRFRAERQVGAEHDPQRLLRVQPGAERLGVAHHQHRHVRALRDAVGVAAQLPGTGRAPAQRGDHDQLRLMALRHVEQHLVRRARLGVRLHGRATARDGGGVGAQPCAGGERSGRVGRLLGHQVQRVDQVQRRTHARRQPRGHVHRLQRRLGEIASAHDRHDDLLLRGWDLYF